MGSMRAAIVIATGLATLAGSNVQASPLNIQLTERDDGRTVFAPVGSQITVHLRQQAGTAYLWELRRDRDHVELIGPARTVDLTHDSNAVGFRQDRVFQVRVVGGGRFPLIFGLRAPYAGSDQSPANRVLFNIDAR